MRSALLCLALILLCGISLRAQDASVSGRVQDPSGSVVPGTQVTLVNDATNVGYSATTNEAGIYSVPSVPPGKYHIQVSRNGFKNLIKPDVILHLQDAPTLNFTLEVGAASESVTVEGGAPLVNTTDAAVSTVIDRDFVEKLPLNGRSFNTLLQLTPGVVVVPTGSVTPGQFSINGQRPNGNYFVVDGVSANFGLANAGIPGQTAGGALPAVNAYGGTSALVSADALQEFRIETSSYAPEFGRQPGGQIIISTRSGTNQFHGDAFEYFRNNVLDANDWLSNATIDPSTGKSTARAPLRQNDFGGVLGGPILRDKTFFFFSYEGLRLRTPATTQSAVPSAAARSEATGLIQSILNSFPQPNGPDLGGDTALFTAAYSNTITLNATSLRVDHRLRKDIQLFGRFNYAPSSSLTYSLPPNLFFATPQNTLTATAGVTVPISQSFVNSFRGNYSRFEMINNPGITSLGGAVPLNFAPFLPSPLSTSNSNVLLLFNDVSALSAGNISNNTQSQLNLVDDLSLVRGRHSLKFGVDFRGERPDFGSNTSLFYFWNSVPESIAPGAGPAFFSASGIKELKMSFRSFSLYAQDNWNLNARAVFNYGLRWEVDPAPTSVDGPPLQAFSHFNDPQTVTPAPTGTPLWTTKYTNFAPRVGIAYKLTRDGTFVLRSGWGIFYDLGIGTTGNIAGNAPYVAAGPTITNAALPVADPLSTIPPFGLTVPLGRVNTFDPNLQLPYSMQWNVALEKAVGSADAISVTYLGQAGRRMLFGEQSAQSTSQVSGRFFSTINAGTSSYNAVQVQWKHRLSHGLQVLANYSYSHSIDTASSDNTESPTLTQVNLAQERGNSDFDLRHNFTSAVTYALPGGAVRGWLGQIVRGWSLDGLIEARSSLPVNVTTNQVLVDPTLSQPTRPDLVPNVAIYLPTPSAPGGWVLNPKAFALPSTPRQGDLGRNSIHGFGFTQMDTSLGRPFKMRESLSLLFRVDAFNILNHPNFGNPVSNFDDPLFGRSTSMLNNFLGGSQNGFNPLFQQGGPRSLQLSLKLQF
jgi:hypothetical protein